MKNESVRMGDGHIICALPKKGFRWIYKYFMVKGVKEKAHLNIICA